MRKWLKSIWCVHEIWRKCLIFWCCHFMKRLVVCVSLLFLFSYIWSARNIPLKCFFLFCFIMYVTIQWQWQANVFGQYTDNQQPEVQIQQFLHYYAQWKVLKVQIIVVLLTIVEYTHYIHALIASLSFQLWANSKRWKDVVRRDRVQNMRLFQPIHSNLLKQV